MLPAKVCPFLIAEVFDFRSVSAYTDGKGVFGSSADRVGLIEVPWAETASVWCSSALSHCGDTKSLARALLRLEHFLTAGLYSVKP